jgi:hypothetical protein
MVEQQRQPRGSAGRGDAYEIGEIRGVQREDAVKWWKSARLTCRAR